MVIGLLVLFCGFAVCGLITMLLVDLFLLIAVF